MLPRRARSDRTTRDAAGPSPVSPPRCGWGYPHCAVGGGESGSRACPGMPAVRDRSRGVLLPRDRRAWRMDIPSRCPFHSRRGRLGDSAVGVSEGGKQHVGRSPCSRNLCQHSRAPQRDFARRRPLDPPLALRVDIVGTVDHNMDERGIPTTPSTPFPRAPKRRGRAAAPLVRCLAREPTRRRGFCLLVLSHAYLRRPLGACIDLLFSTSAASASAPINDVPLLGDDPADAIRSASATSASAISS